MGKVKYEEGLDGYDWYEGQPKWPLSRILKVVFYTISAIVWGLILLRLFFSGNHLYEDKLILLNERAAEIYPHKVETVIRINSQTNAETEQEDKVFVYYPIYLPEVENMQLTVRIHQRKMPAGDGEIGYRFVLRESGAEETLYHELSYFSSKSQLQYKFYRLCFEGVVLKTEKVYTLMIFPEDYNPESEETPFLPTHADFLFAVCNSDTYCNETRPDQDAFKTLSEME